MCLTNCVFTGAMLYCNLCISEKRCIFADNTADYDADAAATY